MKFFRLTAFAIFFIFAGCSTSAINNSTLPDNDVLGIVVSGHPCPETASNRSILAIGTIQLDTDVSGHPCPETLTATFLPDREGEKHWDVTPMLMPPACADCVIIQVLEYKPAQKDVKLKVTLKNPSNFTAYDVRGIVMTNDPDVRLLNADAYTTLWDDGGAVTKNPFRPFAYEVPGRIFYPYTVHSHTYDFTYKNLSGLAGAKLVVDASWPGHCLEAWDIREQEVSGDLAPDPASSVLVTCVVKDWQSDWAGVELDLSSLGFPVKIPMNGSGGTFWAFVFNQFSASPGDYRIWFEAIDSKTNMRLYDDLIITVAAETPSGFKIRPGETFAEASWDWPESSAYVTEYHLFKREKGGEYDYGNPIVMPPTKAVYRDNDVLAGHMYFYKLSAAYELGESELTEEHGGKPFKWGPIVQMSDTANISMYPNVAIGSDGIPWISFSHGVIDNFYDNHSPDWYAPWYSTLGGYIFAPAMAVDSEEALHLTGKLGGVPGVPLRYMKCTPFVSVEKDFVVVDNFVGGRVGMAIDSKGKIYIVYDAHLPGYSDSRAQIWLVTVDTDDTISEPVLLSESGVVDGKPKYKTYRENIFIDENDVIHCAWYRAGKEPESYNGAVYRRYKDGKWGLEENVYNYACPAQGINYDFWVETSGRVHLIDFGYRHFIRDIDGSWSGPFYITHHKTVPDVIYETDGDAAVDIDGNILTVVSFEWGEISFIQKYGDDLSYEHYITSGHKAEFGIQAGDCHIATGPDGLAIVTWMDTLPYGWWEIFARKEIME